MTAFGLGIRSHSIFAVILYRNNFPKYSIFRINVIEYICKKIV